MMRCDEGRLKAWLDGELDEAAAAVVADHVAACADCQAALAVQEQAAQATRVALAMLDPEPSAIPATAVAWAQARAAARAQEIPRMERWTMNLQRLRAHPAWRPAMTGVTVVVAVAVVLAFAPARQAAAQLLQLFRVNSFAVVPVSEQRMQQLQGLDGVLESGMMGQTTTLREAGPEVDVADAAAASTAAGFAVRVPSAVPDGLGASGFFVQRGPAVRLEYERAQAEALLTQAGITDVPLPPVERATVGVDLPMAAVQSFGGGEGQKGPRVQLMQMTKPTIDVPKGVDLSAFGESLLRLLGVPADEAASLARTIDWTSTFVIPVPSSFADFRGLTVDGVPAVLINGHSSRGPQERVVLWQRDGIVYGLTGTGVSDTALLQMADSLR
jgi:hypothetical protein